MTVISISMTPELLERLDDFIEKSGYSSRSEAIRLAIRDGLSHFALGSTYCIDVFIIRGPLEVVLDFIRKTKAIRGISEVKYTMTPIEDNLD